MMLSLSSENFTGVIDLRYVFSQNPRIYLFLKYSSPKSIEPSCSLDNLP